jgi:hypothetical protein
MNDHDHSGSGSRQLDPQFFLPLPILSSVPSVDAPFNEFIYLNGATYRRYMKANKDWYYVTLTKV